MSKLTETEVQAIREEYMAARYLDNDANADRYAVASLMDLVTGEFSTANTDAVKAKYGEAVVDAILNGEAL